MAEHTHTYKWHLSPTLRAAGTPYQVLGVARDATREDIRLAGRKAEMSAHPDKGGSTEQFDLVRLAKRVLETSENRELYDAHGEFLDMGPGAHEQEAPSCRHLHPHTHPHPH
jgi:DnaJ-class molecular chaperone